VDVSDLEQPPVRRRLGSALTTGATRSRASRQPRVLTRLPMP